jgi:hypothetical protein
MFFPSFNMDPTNLITPQLDLELFSWLEVKQDDAGSADQQVAVTIW